MWQAAGLLRAEQGEPLTFTDAEEAIMAAPSAGPDAGTLAALRQGTRASTSRICRLEQVRRGPPPKHVPLAWAQLGSSWCSTFTSNP